jgi:DNA-binding CsgD family transcriptional regulator
MISSEYYDFIQHHAPEIDALCQPLFEILGLNYFAYSKLYKNGRGLFLSSDSKWIKHRFNSHAIFNSSVATAGVYYWDHYVGAAAKWVQVGKQYFNYHRGQTLIIDRGNYFEIAEFAEPKNNLNENSLSYPSELLTEFTAYFRENAHLLLELLEKNYLFKFNIPQQQINTDLIQLFLNRVQAKKYLISSELGNQHISHREYQCFKLLTQYHSAKDIAKNLKLSFRTVENYINSIKNKLGCRNKKELIQIALNNGVF